MATTTSLSIERLLQSLDLSRFLIIAHKFSMGFKSGEFPDHFRILFVFITVPSISLRHDMETDLAENNPHHLEMLFACKTPSEKILWGSFSFSGGKSLYPISRMINADKYIDVI